MEKKVNNSSVALIGIGCILLIGLILYIPFFERIRATYSANNLAGTVVTFYSANPTNSPTTYLPTSCPTDSDGKIGNCVPEYCNQWSTDQWNGVPVYPGVPSNQRNPVERADLMNAVFTSNGDLTWYCYANSSNPGSYGNPHPEYALRCDITTRNLVSVNIDSCGSLPSGATCADANSYPGVTCNLSDGSTVPFCRLDSVDSVACNPEYVNKCDVDSRQIVQVDMYSCGTLPSGATCADEGANGYPDVTCNLLNGSTIKYCSLDSVDSVACNPQPEYVYRCDTTNRRVVQVDINSCETLPDGATCSANNRYPDVKCNLSNGEKVSFCDLDSVDSRACNPEYVNKCNVESRQIIQVDMDSCGTLPSGARCSDEGANGYPSVTCNLSNGSTIKYCSLDSVDSVVCNPPQPEYVKRCDKVSKRIVKIDINSCVPFPNGTTCLDSEDGYPNITCNLEDGSTIKRCQLGLENDPACNVTETPPTGSMSTIISLTVGFIAIICSIYYFNKK